jgi:hypothetical protein
LSFEFWGFGVLGLKNSVSLVKSLRDLRGKKGVLGVGCGVKNSVSFVKYLRVLRGKNHGILGVFFIEPQEANQNFT